MGLRDRLRAPAEGFRGLRRLFADEDEKPTSIERFLLALVRAVRDDEPELDQSARDVFEDARRRRRRLALVSFGAGPLVGVANQVADLYCDTATVCELVELHGLDLRDERVAAHMLVLWSATDSIDEAQAAIDGTGPPVAVILGGELSERVPERLTARTAVKALWQARGAVDDLRKGASSALGDVVFTGKRTKQLIARAERQLGVR